MALLSKWSFRFPASVAIVSFVGYLAWAATCSAWCASRGHSHSGDEHSDHHHHDASLASLVAQWIGALFLWTAAYYLAMEFAVHFVYTRTDLRRRYGAKWALVTGASSGVGAALARGVAQQGLNVVLVALDDPLLRSTATALRDEFPQQQFRTVGVDLCRGDYDKVVAEATADIDVQVVFNNAGYVLIGTFANHPLEKHLANLECNVVAGIRLTHVFYSRLVEKKLRGVFVFTSSAGALFPAPAQSMYSAGKALISAFAASLATEAAPYGIDVMSVQPGPMATNFYTSNVSGNVPQLGSFKPFLAMANTPDEVADVMLRSISRLTWVDTGVFAFVMRLVMRLVDVNAFVMLVRNTVHLSGDWKMMSSRRS